MNDQLQTPATADPVPPKLRPSEPLPPHPAFATVVKLRHSRRTLWIVVVVIILLGGISGTYYWQQQQISKLTAQKVATTRTVTALNNQIATLQRSTPTKGVLKIPELGIQLNLPSSLSDMTYAVVGHSTGNTSVGLSTLGLITLDQNCNAAQAPLGWLSKTAGQYPSHSAEPTAVGNLVKQYPNYYIAYTVFHVTCSNSKAAQNLQTTDTAALPDWSTATQPLQ